MGESYSSQVLAAMDRLWFHHIILSSETTSVLSSKAALQTVMSSSSESLQWEGDYASTNSSTTTISQNDLNNEVEEGYENRVGRKRLARTKLKCNKSRSQSSSPSIQRARKSLNNDSMKESHKLQKFSSCSTLHDLELEELKGFMDLGFQFEKDQLSPRTMSVVPGLQRLGEHVVTTNRTNGCDDIEGQREEKKVGVLKPYLSEAWMVKRPDSPLLRLKMARVSRAEEMKECLKLWARTVASSVHSD
ncbi:hypothetical protein SOVF_033700 [Spinacia oleracea]|uniref:Uncharacterized protein n=1 Tax=Spinacia oleracea TaxID=3562 RepID=A0A9R0JUB1_SPIOL|nr:uncharacterized protein LOC110787127 [Spinacia oleracea]KNA22496.1 hypothetical protein SOVF_033700 [Spinacia oleracea]